MKKFPTLTENEKKQSDKHKNATKIFSWSNDNYPNSVVKPVYRIPTFLLTAKVVNSKGHI